MIWRAVLSVLIVAIHGLSPQVAAGQAHIEASGRLQAWSGDRLGGVGNATVNAEAWARLKLPIGGSVTLRGEGWGGIDPRGNGRADADLREGLIEARIAGLRVSAGRQVLSWGRADRINPTDMLAARDYTRLVEEEEETRLGQATLSVGANVGGGTVTAYWVPEFRPTKLPFQFTSSSLPLVATEMVGDNGSYALRYEHFGGPFDFSVTYAEGPDHTPWFAIENDQGAPALQLRHPRVRTIGADLALTAGDYGVRVEVARYSGWNGVRGILSPRTPHLAGVIAVDRSFPRGWLIIAQAIVRFASNDVLVASPSSALSARNASVHGAWRKAIAGATFTVHKTFATDRGRAELTSAWLQGGGTFLQGRASFAIADNFRLQILGEHFDGPGDSYFGRLSANNILMIGVRAGY
jgi:hypothetical protein